MVEHIRALGVVSVVRSILELLLGVYLLVLWQRWAPGYDLFYLKGTPEAGDREVVLVIGVALVGFAMVRAVQSLFSLYAFNWARRLGLVLAVFDFATPITLPLAFWSLVVYLHPETRDHFQKAGRSETAGSETESRGSG
ncbi:MAG: hypothetical protein O7J95_08615 [Planctomycetota bacterium]|nr:hypothetical protein [Planctomycetota bacterium]